MMETDVWWNLNIIPKGGGTTPYNGLDGGSAQYWYVKG